jgi:hypothetical protein
MTYTLAYISMLLLESCEVEQYDPKVVDSILHFPAMRSAQTAFLKRRSPCLATFFNCDLKGFVGLRIEFCDSSPADSR